MLDDSMFMFWYRFVSPELSRITAGMGDDVCGEVFDELVDSHIGIVFEECAKQYMWRALKRKDLPISFNRIGRWWGSNPKERREEEVDFIAYLGKSAIFGECKWKNTLIGDAILNDLVRKSKLFQCFLNINYIMFSKSGFTDELIKRAAGQNKISLISVDDMFRIEDGSVSRFIACPNRSC